MKLNLLARFTLAFLAFAGVSQAQQTNSVQPVAPQQTAPAQPQGPASNYNYHETFGPLFYTKNGTEYRAANGEPVPKYWQNKTDYQLAAKLNDETNEIS